MTKIERMTLEDIDEIMEIENQSFKVPWKYNDFKETLDYENIAFFVAKEDDVVTGYCGIYMSLDQADIANVAVSSLYRRKGIAEELISHTLSMAKDRGVKEIFLEVRKSNVAAISLYLKMGFAKIGIRKNYYTNPIEDALIMLKLI